MRVNRIISRPSLLIMLAVLLTLASPVVAFAQENGDGTAASAGAGAAVVLAIIGLVIVLIVVVAVVGAVSLGIIGLGASSVQSGDD